MKQELNESIMIKMLAEKWQNLTDKRKASPNLHYKVSDAALSALAMYYVQSPSFLAFQRDMNRKRGRDNVQNLFLVQKIPSDAQIRNLLDQVSPYEFKESFECLYRGLERSMGSERLLALNGKRCIAWDGTNYYHSSKKCCQGCLKCEDSQGTPHYRHAVLMAMQMCQGENDVISLTPEMIANTDGQMKQDCERKAAHRWLERHVSSWMKESAIFLGDDLYANQPLCESIVNIYHQHFIFVAKAESHSWMYDMLGWLNEQKLIQERTIRVKHGKRTEIHRYRWVDSVPLKLDANAMHVQWFELSITDERTGKQLYQNAWITDMSIDYDSVVSYAQVARRRWMIENEGNNTLKNLGYHLEHNFGHGKRHLSSTLLVLNLLAFLIHTIQQLICVVYQRLRKELGARLTYFQSLATLLRFNLFESWLTLYRYMFDGLNLVFPSIPIL